MMNDIETPKDVQTPKETPKEGWTFSVRFLGVLTLLLLGSSSILLMNECASTLEMKNTESKPIISKWKVSNKNSRVPVKLSPWKKSLVRSWVEPGQIVEAYGEGTSTYILLFNPERGYAKRKGELHGNDMFERVTDDENTESFICPLFQGGWWPEDEKKKRVLYAPIAMVFSQMMWNAMQVLQMFLLISLSYVFNWKKFVKFLVFVVVTCLLSFSHHLPTPGGFIFAYTTLFTCICAILKNGKLTLSIGGKNITGKKVVREETIAFLCNLCCSLYNNHSSRNSWPYWNQHFRKIDKMLGWIGGTPGMLDTHNVFYTMGLPNIRTPRYVARTTGSTIGSNLFAVLWSFLPFIYVCYFGCLYMLSSRSPRKNIQRGLCMFGAFHFLFLTDAVSYFYGRGFWNPYSEVFHWFERWSWRIAILLPIYQNCTNGHWIKGHSRPRIGKIVHYFMGVWGLCFFVQQVLFSDIFKFVQFMNGWKLQSVTEILGLPTHFLFSYHGALVVMFIMYGVMIVGGFSNYRVFEEARAKWHVEGEASLERRKQYLEQRQKEIKQLLWTTENPTDVYVDESDIVMV